MGRPALNLSTCLLSLVSSAGWQAFSLEKLPSHLFLTLKLCSLLGFGDPHSKWQKSSGGVSVFEHLQELQKHKPE